MTENLTHKVPRWVWVALAVFSVASGVALVRLALRAVEKISSGEGLDTYKTAWGVEFNYIGLLVMFGVVFLAVLLGLGFQLREWWQLKQIERKYGKKST
jgi:hypothetical protein